MSGENLLFANINFYQNLFHLRSLFFCLLAIHHIPKWPPFRYSFVFIEIRP